MQKFTQAEFDALPVVDGFKQCPTGDIDAFRAKVRADGDALKCLQYLGFANIVAATWCPEKVEI